MNYEAPADGRTTSGARRLEAVFIRELFGDFTDDQPARTEFPGLSRGLRARFEELPPEAIGDTAFIGPSQAEIFRGAMRNLLSDTHHRIPAFHAGD